MPNAGAESVAGSVAPRQSTVEGNASSGARWRARGWAAGPYLLLAAVTIAFFWDSFFAGQVLCMRDTYCDFLPWRQFVRQALSAGEIPLWNPYSHCGQPFIAHPQRGFFYPLQVVFFVGPIVWGLKLWLAIHVWILAAGWYALARHWQLSRAPALLAAVSFALGTYSIANLEFQSVTSTLAWFPWMWLAASHVTERARAASGGAFWRQLLSLLPSAGLLALAIALSFLAGNIHLFVYEATLIAAYVIAWLLWQANWRALIAAVCGCLVAGIAALMISAPQSLLTLELLPQSVRAGAFDPGLEIGSLAPRQLFAMVVPFLFGRPGLKLDYWTPGVFEFWLGTAYLGLVPLALAGLTPLLWGHAPTPVGNHSRQAPAAQHRFLVIFFLAVGAVGVLLALGKFSPLADVCEGLLRASRFRWPAKFMIWPACSVAMLGALGWQAAISSDGAGGTRVSRPAWVNRYTIAWCGAILLAVAALAAVYLAAKDPAWVAWICGVDRAPDATHFALWRADYRLALATGAAALVVVWLSCWRPSARWLAAALLAVAALDVTLVGRQVQFITDDNIYSVLPSDVTLRAAAAGEGRVCTEWERHQMVLYGSRRREDFLAARSAMVGDSWLPLGVPKVWGSGELVIGRYRNFVAPRMLGGRLDVARRQRFDDLLGVRQRIVPAPRPPDAPRVKWVPTAWEENPTALPRAWFASRLARVPDDRAAANLLLDPAFDVSDSATVDDTALAAISPARLEQMRPDANSAQVLEIVDGWNRQSLLAETQQPALLVIGETWFPGWQALVDGVPQPLLRVDVNYRGIMLDAGRHRIELRYRPWQFPVGCAVGALGLAVVALALVPRLGGRWAATAAESLRGATLPGGGTRESKQQNAPAQSRSGQGTRRRRRRTR